MSEQNFDNESQRIWNKPKPEIKSEKSLSTSNKTNTILDNTFTGGKEYVAAPDGHVKPAKTESTTLIKSQSIVKPHMKQENNRACCTKEGGKCTIF
jgi:hypothetical protein